MVPVAHFAVGMLLPFVVTAALLPTKRRWLIYAPVVITLCGLWSLVPDIPVYFARKFHGDEMRWFVHEKIGNLFFFHKALDHLGETGGVWGLAMVVSMYVCIILGYVVYIRHLLKDIREKKAVIRALSVRAGGQSEDR
jgi:hypothetical protein